VRRNSIALDEHEASVLAGCAFSMSCGHHAIDFGSNLTHTVLARDFVEISAVAPHEHEYPSEESSGVLIIEWLGGRKVDLVPDV